MQGLFNRSNESRPAENKPAIVETTEAPGFKALPDLPSDNTQSSAAGTPPGPLTDKALPAMPAIEPHSPPELAPATHDPRQRASISLPPSSSFNSMPSGRFYSQTQAEDALYSAQHTRSQSQPLMFATPLSPIAPSESDSSGSQPPRTHGLKEDGSEKQESHLSQDQEPASDPPGPEQNNEVPGPTQPSFSPNPSVKSRKPVHNQPEASTAIDTAPRNASISATSSLSAHPHRNEARSLNDTTEPVELAMTKDDSSEEIVMSPTAYPGQEWTPMHL